MSWAAISAYRIFDLPILKGSADGSSGWLGDALPYESHNYPFQITLRAASPRLAGIAADWAPTWKPLYWLSLPEPVTPQLDAQANGLRRLQSAGKTLRERALGDVVINPSLSNGVTRTAQDALREI